MPAHELTPHEREAVGRMAYRVRFYEATGRPERADHWRGRLEYESRRLGVEVELPPDAPLVSERDIAAWDRAERLAMMRSKRDAVRRNSAQAAELHEMDPRYPSPTEHRQYVERCDGAIEAETLKRPATMLRTPTRRPRPRGAGRPAVRGGSRRSSARSGDSGDDGPGSSEGDGEPSARPFLLLAHPRHGQVERHRVADHEVLAA